MKIISTAIDLNVLFEKFPEIKDESDETVTTHKCTIRSPVGNLSEVVLTLHKNPIFQIVLSRNDVDKITGALK